MASSEPSVHTVWETRPPSLGQEQAWKWLWTRLLGDGALVAKNSDAPESALPEASIPATGPAVAQSVVDTYMIAQKAEPGKFKA
jgi:hypothetical protein